MLIEFRVENHRSIRDEQVLTMETGRVGASDDPTPRTVPGCSEKILPVAALYGANASGKSNVLAALAFMKEAVIYSHRSWSPDEGIPRDPFAWGQRRSEPSMFEVEIVIDGVRYRYGFRLNDEVFLEEWLYAWPKGKQQTWLVRDGENFEYGKHLMGENKVIEGVTRTNALFLSAAAQLKHPQLSPIFSWFGSIETINIPNRRTAVNRGRLDPMTLMLMDEERDRRQPTLFGDVEAARFPAQSLQVPAEERGCWHHRHADKQEGAFPGGAIPLFGPGAEAPERSGRCVAAAGGRIARNQDALPARAAHLADDPARTTHGR